MRRGISYIANGHSKVNNEYIESYDDIKPSKYMIYLDANNLYGWTMNQYFPYSGIKWLNWKGIDMFDVNAISENNLQEKILEVDFEYPDELHESHNDYPLAPEKLEIS